MEQVLEDFQVIQNRRVHLIIRILPWILLVFVVVFAILFREDMRYLPHLPIFFIAIITIILNLIIFQRLIQYIPETLSTLWNQKSIVAKPKMVLTGANSAEEVGDVTPSTVSPVPLETQYRVFIYNFEKRLNSTLGQLITGLFMTYYGIIFLTIVFEGWFSDVLSLFILFYFGIMGFFIWLIVWLSLGLFLFIWFIAGLIAWRMIIIGVQIWRLGKEFDFSPQPRHPDRAGGLLSLGNLCLWNALMVTISSISLGGLILTIQYFESIKANVPSKMLKEWSNWISALHKITPLLYVLLAIAIVIAMVAFFIPLWGVHQTMVAKQLIVSQKLDQLDQNITHLAHELLDRVDDLEPDDCKKMANDLLQMQVIYQQNQYYPTWPFNFRTIAKFVTAQTLGLVGLVIAILRPFLQQ